eukprot:scaffold40799_cov31-Cyclotella_meneghiniana.AAC.5
MESCLHVGEPPSNFGSWESKTIYIHNFLDLADTKGDDNVVDSPEFTCFGHVWKLGVYPGGVTVDLCNQSNDKITVDFRITVLKADGKESHWTIEAEKKEFASVQHDAVTHSQHHAWGDDIVSRAKLVENQSDYFDNGALKIKLQMRLSEGYYHNIIVQHLPICHNMDVFQDDKTSDVAFHLKGEIIVAHKCIIKSTAPDFYVMCEGYSMASPMPITDVDKDIFEIMLKSLYGGRVRPVVLNTVSAH